MQIVPPAPPYVEFKFELKKEIQKRFPLEEVVYSSGRDIICDDSQIQARCMEIYEKFFQEWLERYGLLTWEDLQENENL